MEKRKRFNRQWILIGMLIMITLLMVGCSEKKSKKTRDQAEAHTEQKKASAAIREEQTLWLSEWKDIAAPLREEEKKIQITSNDPNVIAVSENGFLHAVGMGTAKVTISAGKKKYQSVVKVKKRGMVYPSFSMMKGEHLDLQFSNNQKAKDYSWRSQKPSVATVSAKGKIQAKKQGKTVITGISKEGTVFRCNLTVTKKVKKIIYLTFDDGPNRYTTPKILKILKKNNIKATFFELKPAKKDFDLTKRILDEGHTLALHGYQHKYDKIYKSEKVYRQNLDQLRDLFFQKFGVWCTLSRFPGGSSNMVSSYNPGIMTRLTKKLDGWGYHYFDWNVSSGDAGGADNAREVFRSVKNELSKTGDNVVLMHDFYKNDKTIRALDKIIRYGKSHGCTFLPMTASTEEVHHRVNN